MKHDGEFHAPATLRRLSEIVDEYDEKVAGVPAAVEDFRTATTAAELASCVGGTYARNIWTNGNPSLHAEMMRRNLLSSAWRHVYHGLNIDKIAPVADRRRFDMAMESPPAFTIENIRATFGRYVSNPREHILRGLAECFCTLDDAYKSHSKVKVGVSGLPKRVIIGGVCEYGLGYGRDRLTDVLNALRMAASLDVLEYATLSSWLKEAQAGPAERDGVTLKRFMNGNVHLVFGPEMLRTINLALAEYYGDVLPDAPAEGDGKPEMFASAPAKDLQFYPTPPEVIAKALYDILIRDGQRVLEPSCGDGRIMDALREKAPGARLTGVELNAERAQKARGNRHAVHTANFLETTPDPVFDYVVMNPPFYGRHYQKHVDHAKRFLKPGGVLIAILPGSACYDHGYVKKNDGWRTPWTDLPPGSFAASGTNIPTGIYRFKSEVAA